MWEMLTGHRVRVRVRVCLMAATAAMVEVVVALHLMVVMLLLLLRTFYCAGTIARHLFTLLKNTNCAGACSTFKDPCDGLEDHMGVEAGAGASECVIIFSVNPLTLKRKSITCV